MEYMTEETFYKNAAIQGNEKQGSEHDGEIGDQI